MEYVKGYKHGLWKYFDKKGRLLYYQTYSKGLRNGAAVAFSKDGKVKATQVYRDGEPWAGTFIRSECMGDRTLRYSEWVVVWPKAYVERLRESERNTALLNTRALAQVALICIGRDELKEAGIQADYAVELFPDGPWGYYAKSVLAQGHERPGWSGGLSEKGISSSS